MPVLSADVVQAAARVQMAKVDCLLVPTALHHYTVKEIELEERPAEQDDKPAQVNSVLYQRWGLTNYAVSAKATRPVPRVSS